MHAHERTTSRRHYIPALFSPVGKALVLLLGAALLACGLYGLTALEVRALYSVLTLHLFVHYPISPHLSIDRSTTNLLPSFPSFTGAQLGLEPQLAAPTGHYLIDYYDTQFSLGEAGR